MRKDNDQAFQVFLWMRQQLYQKQLDYQDNTDEGKKFIKKAGKGIESITGKDHGRKE